MEVSVNTYAKESHGELTRADVLRFLYLRFTPSSKDTETMHHHSNKRHAREQYGVQERDTGAWKPPASRHAREQYGIQVRDTGAWKPPASQHASELY